MSSFFRNRGPVFAADSVGSPDAAAAGAPITTHSGELTVTRRNEGTHQAAFEQGLLEQQMAPSKGPVQFADHGADSSAGPASGAPGSQQTAIMSELMQVMQQMMQQMQGSSGGGAGAASE